MRIAARAPLPRCTVRLVGALLSDAPSARLDGQAAPLVAVHGDRSAALGLGAAREGLLFIAPPVEAGALLEVTFRTVARAPPPPPPLQPIGPPIGPPIGRRFGGAHSSRAGSAPPLMEIAVCVESTSEDSSRGSVTVRGEIPVVKPFALMERAFAVPGRAWRPEGARVGGRPSFEVTRHVQCRVECTAPCALTVLSYSLVLRNATATLAGRGSAPPLDGPAGGASGGAAATRSAPEPLVLEPGQQIHAAYRVVATR